VAVDAAGQNIFIGDTSDHLVRWLAGPQAGPPGQTGAIGPQGQTCPAGSPGQQGAPGSPGAQGRRGPDAQVTCKTAKAKKGKVKVSCKVTFTAPRATRRARATLSRGRQTYAQGSAAGTELRTLRLRAARPLTRGRYTLTLGITDADGRTATATAKQTIAI